MSANPFLEAIEHRHSHYAIGSDSPIPDERIKEIVNKLALTVPSSFNTQTTRIVVLFGDEHRKLWDIAHDALKATVPAESFEGYTGPKLKSFRAGHGTAMFFTDPSSLGALKEKFPTYAQHFEPWADQSNGMSQFALWTALDAEGLGASLQHYNPLIDRQVTETWKLPLDWVLRAQLVFGNTSTPAQAKEKKPLSELVQFHGA